MTALRHRAWIAAFLAAFIAGLVIGAPAAEVARMAGLDPARLGITLSGSLGHWTARFEDGGQARFTLAPSQLLRGRYGGALAYERPGARFDGRVAFGLDRTASIEAGTLAADLGPLTAALALPPDLLSGRVDVALASAVWREGARPKLACRGQVGGLRATAGGSALALGDLDIACSEGGSAPGITISDRGGPLRFAATLVFDARGGFRFSGRASAAEDAPAALRDALPMFGRADAEGGITFRMDGDLARFARAR